ncbi:hypothetical protein SHAM105786_07955 [Shewanella amazonensis]|uniref:Uncharacterized protein n=1 Tax=Shewanella amazonensis (strain ATCC BAA-1098 / SB2B) TaxID=326297 RepID=A1S3U5_SHEAM|nr:hypothetical protein [Shewanella amazonensis]ABL99051.1 conserved hypothetical protein [Shewanella amazonensis SB2B]
MTEQSIPKATPMPKRLIALMLLYTAAAVSGIVAKQGVIFCLLTLLMVVAVFARQRAGLWFLRGYTVLQLAMVSLLPFILDQGDDVATGPNTLNLAGMPFEASDYAIFAVLIGLCMVQVWLVFTPKVGKFFNRAQNFNLMS